MIYQLSNGNKITIPNEEIKANVQNLQVSPIEAIQIWLEDNEYEINEEQKELNEKASKVSSDHSIVSNRGATRKPIVVKVSDEKKDLFQYILDAVSAFSAQNGAECEVTKENKLISVAYNGKNFKIDLVEHRKKS